MGWLARALFGLVVGRRLPRVEGTLAVAGITSAIRIRRDGFGIPVIEADVDDDAWFGLGFCHGQDRAFQLESMRRLVHGTLAEWIGRNGLPVDRISRRIGFRRAAEAQLPALSGRVRSMLEAYAHGTAAGASQGLTAKPHELALLGDTTGVWDATDVLAVMKLQSFALASNWDMELERARLLLHDGPAALEVLDPVHARWLQGVEVPRAMEPVLNKAASDLDAFLSAVGGAGGSNNWAIAASRTATGRPILANDPHLPPSLPSAWYLAHVRTPHWAIAGASWVGGPAFPCAHNGSIAWGITAGLVDNTDLVLEEIGADGVSVRDGAASIRCDVREEHIAVRGGAPEVERVLEGPRGPMLSIAADGRSAVALRAVWLEPHPVEGLLELSRARSFAEFRSAFAQWPGLPLNLVYADTSGNIAWMLAGRSPVRRTGFGSLPHEGWDPESGWTADAVPAAEMPSIVDPPGGFVATANNAPPDLSEKPFLGADWIDDYRLVRIQEALSADGPWDREAVQRLQLDQYSMQWRELASVLLQAPATDAAAAKAIACLARWDGRVAADSPAAAVFELFMAEMACGIVERAAPRSAKWRELGLRRLLPQVTLFVRRAGHLSRLIRESEPQRVAAALAAAVRKLAAAHGSDPSRWAWGRVRPLMLRHPAGRRKPLGRVFDLGPIACGGDPNTPAQASVDPFEPFKNPAFIASLRATIDVGAFEESRFAIPGGQSGNPCSPHYGDQLAYWSDGSGLPLPWSEERIAATSVHELCLVPGTRP